MRKLFKHKIADVYMMICITISMLTIFMAVRYFSENNRKEKMLNDIKYDYIYAISYNTDLENRECVDFSKYTSGFDVNFIITGDTAAVGDGLMLVSYIIDINDGTKIPLISGDFKMIKSYKTPSVYIGKGIYKKLAQPDCIVINNDEYKVVGVMGDENNDVFDYSLYIVYGSMSDSQKEIYGYKTNYDIELSTNDGKKIGRFLEVAQKLKEEHPGAKVDGKSVSEGFESQTVVSRHKEKILILLYAFAIINSLIAAVLWVYVRTNEIVISRICKMSYDMIIARLFIELLKLSIISGVISYIAIGLLNGFEKDIKEFLLILGCVPFTTLIISFVPMGMLRKKTLHQMLNDSGVM